MTTFAQGTSDGLWDRDQLHAAVTAGTVVFTNTRTGSLAVVVSIDVGNSAGSEGNYFYLTTSPSGGLFHSGTRGSGSADVFPWRGYKGIPFAGTIDLGGDGGEWDVTICAFYVPDHAGFISS